MKQRGFFSDIKVHIICLALVLVAEFIGIKPVVLGPIKFSLLPMLYALILGIMLSQVKLLDYHDMTTTSPYIGIAVMYLTAFMGTTIGPNLSTVLTAGPALILQEFGNLGTIFFSLPIAIILFKMDRTAVGSTFSISREGSLAIVGDLYGLDSPEGRGVMGSYITGTLLGTIFNGILVSLLLNVDWFMPEALAMAAGTGSASMMSAAIAPIVEAYPQNADVLTSLAASSQVLTSMDGMYMSIFLGIPLTNWLYKKLKGKKSIEEEKTLAEAAIMASAEGKVASETIEEIDEQKSNLSKELWITRIKVLIYSAVFALIANWISSAKKGTPVTPLEALPGMLILFSIIILGNIIKDFLDKTRIRLPSIIYISLIAVILSIPNLWPGSSILVEYTKKLSLLPLCTPILAYAGIATGKDMAEFKKQGIKIVIVTLFALAGTYIGSAVIANVVLKVTGV